MSFEDEYFSAKDVADFWEGSVDELRRKCRGGLPTAVKRSGRWWVHYKMLHPVLQIELHPTLKKDDDGLSKKQIIDLCLVCVRWDIWRCMDLLAKANEYYRLIDRYSREGFKGCQAERLASKEVSMPSSFIERIRRCYLRSGLMGLVHWGIENAAYLSGSYEELVYKDGDAVDDDAGDDEESELLSIMDFLEFVVSYNDDIIDNLRINIEDCDRGREIVATNPNRRLYAVLKPSRSENIERIRQLLCYLTARQLQEVFTMVTKRFREMYPKEETWND